MFQLNDEVHVKNRKETGRIVAMSKSDDMVIVRRDGDNNVIEWVTKWIPILDIKPVKR